MTHDISKPKNLQIISKLNLDAAKESIINGIKNGSVLTLYDAVEVSGASNGNQVEKIFKELKAESDMLSNAADISAAEGKLIDNIIKDIDSVAIHFKGEDIKQMKIEVYNSVIAWKQAISEEV